MKPARYIFLNKELEMSAGKCAAQSAHAETLAMQDMMSHGLSVHELDPVDRVWIDQQSEIFEKWFGDGHYAKYVMEVANATQMFTIKHYLEERGFKCYLVIDEGHTEGTYFVPTAMSVELVDKDDERTSSIFGEFKLYKEPKSEIKVTYPDDRWIDRVLGWRHLPEFLIALAISYTLASLIFH